MDGRQLRARQVVGRELVVAGRDLLRLAGEEEQRHNAAQSGRPETQMYGLPDRTKALRPGGAYAGVFSRDYWLTGIGFVVIYCLVERATLLYELDGLGITLWSPSAGLSLTFLLTMPLSSDIWLATADRIPDARRKSTPSSAFDEINAAAFDGRHRHVDVAVSGNKDEGIELLAHLASAAGRAP